MNSTDGVRRNSHGQPVGEPVPHWSPRPSPNPEVLTGRWVQLQRLTPAYLSALYDATCGPDRASAWTYIPFPVDGAPVDQAALASYLEPMWASPRWAPLAIVLPDAGEVAGMASYMRIKPDVGAVEIGAIMFGPRLAGTVAATEAMWLMARHVFEDLGYRRYEWKCDALNEPSRRAALRLGFSYEGTWRQALVYKGRNRDTAWFAMTDGDWQKLRSAYDVWLDPSNFDTDGAQRTRLSALTRAALADPGH